VVLIDRQSGAKEALEQAGFHLHVVMTISGLLDDWEQTGKVEQGKIAEARAFFTDQGVNGNYS
jgi:orotate phosphoribosyltransferase